MDSCSGRAAGPRPSRRAPPAAPGRVCATDHGAGRPLGGPPRGKPRPAVGGSHSAGCALLLACKRCPRAQGARGARPASSTPLADLTRAPSCSLEPVKVACMAARCCWTGWARARGEHEPAGPGLLHDKLHAEPNPAAPRMRPWQAPPAPPAPVGVHKAGRGGSPACKPTPAAAASRRQGLAPHFAKQRLVLLRGLAPAESRFVLHCESIARWRLPLPRTRIVRRVRPRCHGVCPPFNVEVSTSLPASTQPWHHVWAPWPVPCTCNRLHPFTAPASAATPGAP